MDLRSSGPLLIVIGAGVLVAGILLVTVGRVPFFGQLPGDIALKGAKVSFFFPLVSLLIVSVVLTIVVNLVGRLFR